MTSISVSSFSFYKHLPASLMKRRQHVSSKKNPEPASSTLYYSPFDATARSSVRGSSSGYALPISKAATSSYGYGTLTKGEDWRKTKRRKSLKRSSVKLRPARAWKEVSGLNTGIPKQWKGTKATTHLCKNIRR